MGQYVRGMVAAGHPLTAEAGAAMLRQGGNAFDAAIAAALTACVCESALTSLGGGGFLLAHTAAGENVLFDFFSQTPGSQYVNGPPHFYPVTVNFGDATQAFHIGLAAMAVPGMLAGLEHVHRRLGRLPFKVIAEPAMHWARLGSDIEPFRAYVLKILQPILTATTAAQEIYAPTGTMLGQGDRLRMPAFADILEQLVRKAGLDQFYRGEIAHQIVRDCGNIGGYLSLEDFADYRVVERSPLAIRYRQRTLLTNPPPSSGGILIGFALKLLERANLSAYHHGDEAHLDALMAAMRLTNQARKTGYDQRLHQADIAASFLGDGHLSSYGEAFDGAQAGGNKWGSTTHISVIDAEGNAASITSSNGEGSAYVIPGTQIMVNNMLGEEDLNPDGFHQWVPGRRISSMMAPTILLEQGRPRLVLGSGGSNRIRTAILQVISNVLDFDMDLDQAVNSPRIHWERGVLNLEPGYDRRLFPKLPPETHDWVWWQQPNMFFGGVHAVAMDDDGHLSGAGDPRRGGAVAQS